jgi:hypothetical protein
MVTLYHLVLILCVHGDTCRERRSPDWVYDTSMSCLVDAQRQAAALKLGDPRISLKSFICEPGDGKRT